MELSERIRAWRKARSLSQKDLARRVDVSDAAVSMWETGETEPTQDNLRSVVDAFGLTMASFYGRIPKPKAA